MNWNAQQVAGPCDSDVPDEPKEPPPAVAYCECDRPIFGTCCDCGEPSHTPVGEALFVNPHKGCGPGWHEPAALCPKCQAIEDHDEWYSRNGHGFSCNCGCNGH